MSEFIKQTNETIAKQNLEAFIQSPALDRLAEMYGNTLPETTVDRIEALSKIAENYWDFRKGAERQEVDWSDEQLDQEGSEQWNTIFTAADELGLVKDSEPINKNPNYLVILGGANKAPLDRLRYGLEAIDDCEHVVYLGSSRAISDAEREKANDYAPDAQTEFDLGSGAFEKLLGAKMTGEYTIERNGDTWGMRMYEYEMKGQKRTGFVLSTPQTIGERRATTYDNYKFFADRAELDTHPDKTVVSVTTGFYTRGQHLPAIQELTLPYGTTVETIGHSAEYTGVKRKPTQLLQEIKSAIDASKRLQDAINVENH